MNVIFVHGWACGWQDWCYISSILPDNIKVGIVKLRGSPDAVPLMGNISITECASDVITHADDLGFDNFILVGHSMGARIAIELAANYENRVTNLFLLDGSNLPENPKKQFPT